MVGYIFVVIEAFLALYYMYKGNSAIFKYFLICTILQNLILIVFSNYFNQSSTTAFILAKEFIVYIYAFLYWLSSKRGKVNRIDAFFIVFVFFSLANILFNKVSLFSAISSLRQFLIPYLCYYFGLELASGRRSNDRKFDAEKIGKIFIYVMIITCGISVLLYFPDPSLFWEKLGYRQYLINKTGSIHTQNYTMNFYTYDFGPRIKRIVSIMADPLAFSHLISAAILIYGTLKKKRKWWQALFFICAILSLSKYLVIVLLFYLFWKLYTKTRSMANKAVYNFGLIVIIILAFLWLVEYTNSLTEATSIGNHFNSLVNGLNNITVTGNGIGTTGYNAKLYGGLLDDNSGVGESLFATMITQIGVIGTTIYYAGIILICKRQYDLLKRSGSHVFFATLVLISSLIIETLVSASSISMLGSGIFFVLAGSYEKMYLKSQFVLMTNHSRIEY